jgi:hypothetical protein
MAVQTSLPTGGESGGATSIQGLFLIHHLMALQSLQNILIGHYESERERLGAFERQSMYLVSLITDDDARANIEVAIRKKEAELKENPLYDSSEDEGDNNKIYARLSVVTELCRYLASSMDLIHHDIISSIGKKSDIDEKAEPMGEPSGC